MRRSVLFILSLLLVATSVYGADRLAEVAESGRAQARSAMADLRNFRLQVEKEQIPLEQKIRELRGQLSDSRNELRSLREAADSNEVTLADLENQVERLSVTRSTALSLLDEILNERANTVRYHLDPETRSNRQKWDASPQDTEKLTLSLEIFPTLVEDLAQSIGGAIGPMRLYSGDGREIKGTALFLGPGAWFSGPENQVGVVDTSDPTYPKLSLSNRAERQQIRTTLANRSGLLPLDATAGAALALRQNTPDLLGEIARAGIWIYPILLAAAIALLVATVKWFSLFRIHSGIRRARPGISSAWNKEDRFTYKNILAKQPLLLRPFWETLWETRNADSESREDLLYARLIEIRLRLTRGLAALSVIAATTPLLGLLGTVTGMITTFQRITLFGTGDPQSLSGGISEALLTTKFGLVVAIPTFLLYAYLSRRAQGTVAGLEAFSQQLERKD